MHLRLPRSLHYPVTVTELLKQEGDDVARFDQLFTYLYKTKVTEEDELGGEHEVERAYPASYESNVEGILRLWKIRPGTVIADPGLALYPSVAGASQAADIGLLRLEIAEIEEPCAHGIQFGGMCANCGKDMTEYVLSSQMSSQRAL